MKKILVPIDFTPASRNAIAYAAQLATTFKAEMYLLHAFMEPLPASEAPVAWMITGSELQDEKDKQMNDEIKFLKQSYPVVVSGSVIIGHKGKVIHEMAQEIKADLVVMGMKNEKKSRIMGSTTFVAIRKAGVPVLIIPEHASFVPIKHMVVAADFNELNDVSCFDLLFKLVDQYDASVQVFHVHPKGVEMTASEVPGKMQLGHVFSRYSFQYQEVEDDDVEHGILEFIKNHPTDLLVMVAHHHSIFERLFGRVMTQSIALKSSVPILALGGV